MRFFPTLRFQIQSLLQNPLVRAIIFRGLYYLIRPLLFRTWGQTVLRIFANIVIIVMSIWAIAAAATAMLGATVYFPWVLAPSGEIPPHRLAAIRVGVLLTFAYFGFLHIIGKSEQLYPINFLTTFLLFLVAGGTVVFYKYQVPLSEYWLSAFWGFVCLMTYIASRPLVRDYFKKKK